MKNKVIRLISTFLIVILALGIVMPMPAASAMRPLVPPPDPATLPFVDMPPRGDARDAVAFGFANRLTNGMTQTRFEPNRPITRADFSIFLYRLEGEPALGNTRRLQFSDVTNRNSVYYQAVMWAADNSIVNGIGDGTFRPHQTATRQDIVVMLYRYAALKGTSTVAPTEAINMFPDRGAVSSPNIDAMRWAVNYGIIRGIDGRLLPHDAATRADGLVIIYRYIQKIGALPPTFVNPLTGMPSLIDITQNRPVAVSLSNARGAMPTNAINGISQADIIYEILMEYGETRFLALYQNFGAASTVGSIRSVRHYTVHFAKAHDAILVHAGGSPLGMNEVRALDDMTFNEVHGPGVSIFSRDVNRVPGHTVQLYHSAVTTGAAATSGFSRYRTRTTLRNDFNNTLSFTNNPIPTGGAVARNVDVRFSRQKNSLFAFDERQNLYIMSQRDSVLRDVNNSAPVTFTNLIILRMPTAGLPNDTEGRLDIATVGSGTGHFASNGRVVAINWSRPDINSQFVFTLGNGRAIELGRGKTYIGIIPTEGTNVSVSFR